MRPGIYNILLLLLTTAALVTTATPGISDDVPPLAQPCASCHGSDGNSAMSNIPAIAGITPEYFTHVMDAYKNGGRQSELMKQFTHTLKDEEIAQLAAYFGRQKFVPREQTFDAAQALSGRRLHEKYCEKCHENGGRITENNFGILAGQWMPYLRQALAAYLDESRRVNPMMLTKLHRLRQDAGDDGIEQLVNFYASQR